MPSPKASQIYEYIVDRISNDISPTVREICRDLNIKSTSTVHRYIGELCDENLIIKDDNSNRSIRIANTNVARVPILGPVAAGAPITAIEDIEGYIPFDGGHLQAEDLFALRIEGDSMIECGIFDGDLVIVRKTPVATDGQIVVALVEDSATVKRFYKEHGHYRLQPENETYEPIIVDEVSILGKVIASVRYF